MENINPLISIITAVKNGEKHLEECFESLQNQSYKNLIIEKSKFGPLIAAEI